MGKSVPAFLRRVYTKLPVVRELREMRLQAQLLPTSVLQLQVDDYLRNLLKSDRYTSPKMLSRHERQVFSQTGEDGIIAEIFRRIGEVSRTFVELGVGDGLENNTAYLLFQGWRGFWIDGDAASVEAIGKSFFEPIQAGRLGVEQCFITAENIRETLLKLQVPLDVDLLSLDIDRNTFWIWNSLSWMRPRVVVVEFNAMIPPDIDWKVAYEPNRLWNGTSYWGASLKAYELLGRRFGYTLVGCTLSGLNAFFVREDLCKDRFEVPATAEHHYEPPRYFLFRLPRKPLRSCFSDAMMR